MLLSKNLDAASPEEVRIALLGGLEEFGLQSMVATMGEQGSVFAQMDGESGWCPAREVEAVDTTGAGDAFFAGVAIGLSGGKSLEQSCAIGTMLAASAIVGEENVCGSFSSEELGL